VAVVAVDGEAIVIRFDPMRNAATMMDHAEASRRLTGVLGLSVYADVQGPNETTDEVEIRLLAVAGRRISRDRNRFYYVCEAQDLLGQGAAFYKDETPGEEQEHYTVSVGAGDAEACRTFSRVFTRKRWR
jgi:hypothetical protein